MRNKFASLLTLSCHVPPTDHSASCCCCFVVVVFCFCFENERENELEAV